MFILPRSKGKIEKYSRPQWFYLNSVIVLIVFSVILPLLSMISLLLLPNNTADAQKNVIITTATTTIPPVNRNINNGASGVSYFTLWNDPTENAFTILIPKGWTVHPYLGSNSGVIRSLMG